MRFTLTAIPLALLILSGPQPEAATIRDDLGGQVVKYHMAVVRLNERGSTVRIGGRCASACTLYLSARRYCVEPGAKLQFHAVRYEGNPKAARLWTRWLVSKYPPKVQAWIRARGGLTSRLITLEGEALRLAVRMCSP